MTEGGFYQQKRMNPQAVSIVILLHGAALTALMMAKGDMVERIIRTPIHVEFVPAKPVPPERKTPPKPQTAQTRIDTPRPVTQMPTNTIISDPPVPLPALVPPDPWPLPKLDLAPVPPPPP